MTTASCGSSQSEKMANPPPPNWRIFTSSGVEIFIPDGFAKQVGVGFLLLLSAPTPRLRGLALLLLMTGVLLLPPEELPQVQRRQMVGLVHL